MIELELNGKDLLTSYSIDEIGDDHLFTGMETPMKKDAFEISDQEKKDNIAYLF
jgi:GTP cyclohydrolase I